MLLALAALFLIAEVALLYRYGRASSSMLVSRYLSRGRLRRTPFTILLMPATVLHETAHALVGLIMGMRITRFVPWKPQSTTDGTLLGVVEYRGSANPLKGALIGMAPLLLLPVLGWAAGVFLLGATWTATPGILLAMIPHASLLALAWVPVLIWTTLGCVPSPQDHISLIPALLIIVFFMIIAALTGGLTDVLLSPLRSLLSWFTVMLFIPMLLSCITYFVLRPRGNR